VDHPKKLLEEHSSTPLDYEVAAIQTTADGFEVRFPSWNMLPTVSRMHVRKYERRTGAFARVQPFVDKAGDLPDEWLRLPWNDASQLVVPEARAGVKAWHERIRAVKDREHADDMISIDETSPETETDQPWVSLKCERWVAGRKEPACKELPNKLYVHMVSDGKGYLIASVSQAP
jgi:hypothetical protein